MILVDRQIRDEITSNNLIEHASLDQIQSMLYDLKTEGFICVSDAETYELCSRVTLSPAESVMVATRETINLPNDMIARVVGRNSRIREGLLVDAPVYQPGHHTRVYFRLVNVSNSSIDLCAGKSYASLIFERLSSAPENPYNGTFKDEYDYLNLGGAMLLNTKRSLGRLKKVDE